MPKYKPLYSLYKGLRESKYDVPDSYVSFQKTLTQAGDAGAKSRRGLYQSLKDSNYDVPDTYEDFYKNLFVPVNSTTSRALKIGENPNTPTVNRYRQKMFDSVDPNKNGLNNLSNRAVGQAVRATNNVRKPVVAKVVNQKGKPTGKEFAITPAKTAEDLDREYAQETTKNWENELHDQMADADKDAAKISDMFKAFIGSTDEVGSVWGNMTRGGGIAGTPHSVTTNNGILENTEARQILAAGDYNRKRRELLQLEQDSRNGAIFDNHSFFRGMYDASKDTGLLTGGASDLINAGSLLATKQDLDNGVHTEAGDMLMQQAVKNSDAQSQYGDNQGWMYTGGVITTNMAPFMVQIGSAGFSNGMSNTIGKVVQGAASKVALGTMEKATGIAGAHIANYIGKVTGLTTKAFGKAIQYGIVGAAQANTVGLGNVANDVINRYTGQVYQDEQGNYKFGTFDSDGKLVHEGGEDFLTALVKGEAAQTIEFATELAGGGIDAAGTALKNFVTKGGKKIINKYNMENVSKVIDFLLNNKVSKNARYLKAGADRTLGKVEVNSIVGESLEEELGIIANTVFTGDNKISDLWDEKQQSQIWGGMLLSIGLMKGAVAPFHAYNAKQYYSYKHKLDKADVNLSQLLGKEKWEELRNQIDATTNEDMPEMVNKINRDVALGKNRQPVREYIQNLLIMRGYDIGNMLAAKKAVEDKGEGVSVKNMEKNQAYQQGRDAYGYDTHEIQLDQEDKQKSLAQLLGISEQQLASMSNEELEALSGRDDNIDRAIYDYQLSTARYEGVIDNARDQIDLEVQRAAQAVDMYTDKSRNTIRNATIKATGGLEDYGVYIINGNIATHEDGSIDISNSDDMILYYDPTTNTVEHADAMMFAELGSEENADEVRSQAMVDAKEKAIKETTGIIDGVVEVGTQFKTVDADGTEHTYEVLADNGDGTAMITIDGNIPTELVKGENVNIPVSFEELQKMKDESDQQKLQAAKAQREQMEKERAEQQNQETEETQPSFDFKKILNDNGNVVPADVLDEDGNTRYPNSKLFLIRDSGAKAKVVELKSDGTLKSHAVDKKDVRTATTMTLDEYKQAMPESSMIEDNSGTIDANRGSIEVEDNTQPLSETDADNVIAQMESSAETVPDLELTPDNWAAEFGEDGILSTPIGDVKMGENQVAKLFEKGRSKEFGMIKPTLTNPDVIIEVPSHSTDGNEERSSSYLFIKTFLGKNGKKVYYFKSVTIRKDGLEISISSHYDRAKRVKEALMKGKLLYRKNDGAQTEQNQPSASVTTSQEDAAGSSESKDTNISSNGNENNESLTFEDGTPIPVDVNGEVDLSQTDASHAAEWYDNNLGEDADDWLDGEIKKAKKVLEQAKNKKLTGSKPSELVASKKEKEAAIADAQAHYDSAISIRDSLKERRIAKEENTSEGRKELIEKARRKFARLKSAVKDDAEAVSQLYRDTIGSLLHRLYDGTGIDVTDTIPLTAEEYVASNLGAHSLNYEGTETSKGVKQETGLSREDFVKTQLLAADGKGTTIDALVHSLWENRPSNLESLDTQDIRNALIGVLNSGFKASEARNFVENIRIAQAENILEEQKRAQENAAYAEQQKAEQEAELKAMSDEKAEPESKSESKLDNESNNKSNDLSNETDNEKINDNINDNINAPEVPEDATDENPLGLQLSEDKVPFEIEGGKSGETYDINDNEDRQRLINDNKVDDKDILDIDMPKHVHKAIKELCKKMGLKVQFLYMGARSNGWIENGTMYLALDTEKATQFVFGHEMTHAIKQKNPEAYKELVKVAMAVTTKKKFEEDLAKVFQNYHGISGYNNVDDYVEEVVADNVGKFINDFDLAQKFSLRLNHPVLATILHAIQKIKSLLYGDFYKSVDALERIVEKAYVDTAKGEVTNSETGEDVSFSLRQKPEPKKKGIGYKVFVLKDGKLYPPMVANPDGAATPVGVWLDADAAPIAGESKTGRPQVKQGGKGTQGGSGKLAYRPGWHLGVVPYAIQFNRKDAEGNKTLFPKNFVFAEVEYAADVDYQEEARQDGINPSGKYQHSLAGLKHLPTDGYYMYRTNPNPETDPWVITGAMKVNRILTRAEQAELVKNAGREPQQIQEGDIVTDDVVNSINQEIAAAPKFSLKVYHGSGAEDGDTNYVIFKPEDMKITEHTKFSLRLKSAIEKTETNPSDAQKESGNYKKGHIKFGGYDYTIENPKGSTRSGKDADGKEWKVTMHDTYGYIRGKFGKDGDHLDMFINDKADLDNWNGDVFVVDQVNPDGSFDEHKVMYGYDSMGDAKKAYLANYSKGWQGLGNITGASKDEFDKWLDTSNRKLKPFADYAKVKFSLKDEEYLKAVEDGNMEKAQKMVNEAADAAGYSTDSSYQGTSAFNGAAPWGNGYFLTKDERKEAWDNGEFEGESTLGDYINDDIDGGNLEELTNAASYRAADPMRKEAIDNVRNVIQKKAKTITMYRSVPSDVKEGSFRNGDWVTPSLAYAVDNAKLHGWGDDYNIIEQKVPVDDVWFDGNDIAEWGYGREEDYINDTDFAYKNSKNNKKLLDAVTYDDNGNVIPLSQRFNEKNKDVRFSLKDEKTLVGVHNISEEKLLKAIKQGGLANPSVAVIDSSRQYHKAYGGISLILPSDKIAKRTGKNAGTWQGDAYTPTYPQVERHISDKGSEQVNKDVLSVPKEMQHEVRNGIYRWLDGDANSGLKYLFLHEKGVASEPKMIQPKFSDEAYNELKFITAGDFNIYGIGKADAQKVLDMYIEAKFDGDKNLYEEKTKAWLERNKSIVDAGAKGGMRYAIAKENVELYDEYGFNYKGVQTFVRDVEYDHRKSGVDTNATLNDVEDYIKTNNLTDEFNTWLEGKEKEYGIKEVIFDGFTPSGNRRYVPNTLENVSKIMKKQGRNGATGTAVSFQNFAARLMPSYGTLKDIRSKKGLLTSDREEFDKFREKWSNVFYELGMKCQPDATGTFDDYGLARLSEAAMTSDPQAYLKKEYNVDFSDEDTKRLKEMVKAIKEEHPAMYFETKFERPVRFDEFSAAVVPTTTKKEVKEALKNAGVSIFEYDEKNDADRSRAFNEAINSSDNIRFSLKSMMEKPEGWKQANKKAIHIAEAIERDPKFSLKNLDGTLIKAGTYFSGGGLVEEGLKGIIDPVVAVEYDEKISGVYRNNFGQHIVTADVRDVDPRELVKKIDGEVEYFHASPVCKNYSQAKSNHAELELDKETAVSTAEFINAIKPKVVTIENVKGYKDSDAMKTITEALDANGYTWDADVYNAADYGGYTNRERLIVRAVRDGKLPEKPKKMAHKRGWYEAVADIIPTLTEKKNGVAPWMDVRLKADGIDWRNIDKPLYVMGSAYADGKIPHAFADELLPTLRTKSGDVIVMPDGKVYRAMGRVLARVSGVSDDYKMPFSENLSHTIIGNGIPTQLTEHVIAPLLQNTLRPTTPEDGNTKFSLRYDQFEHDLNQWKKDNNLPKDAQRPTIPQRNAGESAVDFLRRVDEYRKQMALWKTAPTYEQHLLSDDTALGEFNRELQRGSVLKRIAFQDSMLAIRKAQEAIMKEVGVDRLNMAEDAYTAENRSHGKGKNEFEEYNNEFLQPLRKAYHQMKKVMGDSYDNVRIYMMAKHGLERDAQMAFKKSLEADYEDVAQRSAAYKAYKGDMNRIINDSDLEFGRVDFTTWRQRDNAFRVKYSPSYMDYRYDKNGIAYDYSGLSALFDGSDFEEAAYKLVKDIEDKYVTETHNLWDATNAATKKILRDGYKAGMMSKDTYQYVRDMYSHYIPLRGWDGTTADQVWDYIGGGKGAFNQTLKTAHGRTSIADDPIAYIENMAESGILLNNKNWVKQHLMLLAQNHPTSLLTLSKAWYVKSTDANGNEEWIPATPQITSQMNSNQVKAAIDAFEKKMEQMAQTGDATQKRDGLNIAYPQTHSEEREHEVRVMKDGEEYVIYVNGDPQLAQAMNNTRAHRVSEGIKNSISKRVIAVVGRKMAAAYTSLSPLFIPSNYFRDLTMTLASTAIREDAKYNYLLSKNLATSWNLGFMLKDYQNGKLREKVSNGNATPKEQMFYDFMMNGGETGFVSSLDVEDLKKKFKNDLKDLDRWKANPVKVGHTIMDCIEFLNRMIEDSNRFAIYMTSIQYGRSIDEAVNDAKDVTLNFNRKGTGEHSWQTIRNLYLFINPAVQSLQTLGALAKHHPFKFTAVTASWLASGVLVPIVNVALMQLGAAFLGGDGDDDKDWYKDISKKYWQFTKWDRRNNFIMWVPTTHEFVKIPLAQEFRAFYGLGDMIASKMMGGELAEESWEDYGWDLVGQVVDMFPLDPTGYDGELGVSLMPNPIRPVFELAFNVDFTGKPLFKETEYNKYDPNFTKAYVGTPDWLVRASRMVNSIGNDYPDVQQNSIDAFGDPKYNLNNPAVVDHVLSSYLGGAYTMGSQVLGVLTKSLNDPKKIKVADIPLVSKFVSNPDDRPVSKKQGDEFWDKKEYYDRASNTISKLKKQAKIDGDYSLLERFYGSEEYKTYKLYEKDVKDYKEARKKERAEESGDEYRPHQLNAEDIYNNHATPMDEFEDMKLKQLFEKLNSFKTRYDSIVDNAPNESDAYYNTNKAAIDAIDEISLDKQEISELKKGFLDDGKDAYNAEDMKQIRELRKKILAVLEKANKVVVANQKAKAEK